MAKIEHPAAPPLADLPERRPRAARAGPLLSRFDVTVQVVTPILGGSVQPRTVDEIDVIRPATVRGHLRFWWRALHGHRYATAEQLFDAESALWGRAATDQGGRSAVELAVQIERRSQKDGSNVSLGDTGAYALWPARETRERGAVKDPAAPRWCPGIQVRFEFTVPAARAQEVRDTVRAWLLFGGYGGRTRRGVGSLTALSDKEAWLPKAASREEFQRLFGRDIFANAGASRETPLLAGARLFAGQPEPGAIRAWTAALGWLQDFRQGTRGAQGERAREPDPQGGKRASISNWPEADKVRHLTGKTSGHTPRHNGTPAWPRAGFGLPIIGRFQKDGRNGRRLDEPEGFELRWRSNGTEHDRLASPLIVKPLALANGQFVPIALWFTRALPPDARVFLKGVPDSDAPFDRLVAPGDTPRFKALQGKTSLRDAFLDWLAETNRAKAVVR
ncbi:MAG: type III-B CRISPR module RAMP protein Cmr1 [Chloroflexota bacterium]|nr:type III-B CRISPR module RAMP protein Cmr1 [Dehalococcoidia bacterium]MDW8253853.1 type III-B CRISPR module RAMP protein Cmr1 [Chloroflexota bacterium]